MNYVTGRDQIKARFLSAREKLEHGVERGLKNAGTVLLSAAVDIVPLDLGPLRASGKSSPVPENGGGSKTEVYVHFGAGSIANDYAVRQHEVLWYRHLPGRTAKYLERPARTLGGELFRVIAKECVLR